MIVTRSFDDVVLDRIVKALNDFCTAQKSEAETQGEKAAIQYKAYRDRFKPAGVNQLPMVTVWLAGENPDTTISGAYKAPHETISVNVDMITSYVTDKTQGFPYSAAMTRLAYLKEQIRQALYKMENCDFGFEAGIITNKSWPRYTPYLNRSGNPEESVTGGRWSFDLTFSPDQIEDAGIALEEMSVNAETISALYVYTED